MEKKQRMYYIDNLKVFLTCLVILHHVMIAYGGEGAFHIGAKTKGGPLFDLGMTGLLAINQSYFMGLFFLISALFSEKSLRKKGKLSFIHSKVKRILVPALVYYVTVSPIISWCIDYFYNGIPLTDLSIRFNIGVLWFLVALFMFDLLYALTAGVWTKRKIIEAPKWQHIVLMILLGSIVTWLLRIYYPVGRFIPVLSFQPAHFVQYSIAYILGIKISHYNWLKTIEDKDYRWCLLVVIPLVMALIAVVLYVVTTIGDITYAFGGPNLYAFLYSFFDLTMFILMSLGLLSLFYRHFNSQTSWSAFMVDNAYGTYLFHTLGIVLVVIGLTPLHLNHVLAFVLACILSVVVSFIGGRLIRHLLI